MQRHAGWHHVETGSGSLSLDPELGMLRNLTFYHQGRRLVPLNTAHWVSDGLLDPDSAAPLFEQRLAGDFFCAPFGANDVEGGPPHGWSCNSHWTMAGAVPGRLTLALDRPVMGARIEMRLHLAADAPLLYQEHLIRGGQGGLSVAHHPMVRISGGGRFFSSPKMLAITPDAPLEAGGNALACPARSSDLAAFPGADGQLVDLTRLPIAKGCEDFVSLIEAPASSLGWSAVLREAEDDIVFFVKNPRMLPLTAMWHSNGGRDYAPWAGRHTGVLGVEDACAAGLAGHAAALRENPINALGVPTALPLAADRTHRVAHVTGAIARPEGWDCVTGIFVNGSSLTISGPGGSTVFMPFLPGFLKG